MPPRKASTEGETTPATPATPADPEEWEVRRQALLAKLPPIDKRPKTLVGKLALVTSLVGTIRKTGENKHFNYKYVKEADLVEAIRPLLSELGIWIHQTLSWDTANGNTPLWVGHQKIRLDDEARVDTLTILMVAFHFIDGETGETTPVQIFPGYGDDTGDKGSNKALTGAEKYFLMKTFLVATGDDPEADDRADKRAAGRDAATTVTVGRAPAGRAPAAHGGRQQQGSSAQLTALKEAFRSNGIRGVAAAIAELQSILGVEIEGNDATALQTFMTTLNANQVALVIRELGARDTSSQTPSGDAAPETETAPSEPTAEVPSE